MRRGGRRKRREGRAVGGFGARKRHFHARFCVMFESVSLRLWCNVPSIVRALHGRINKRYHHHRSRRIIQQECLECHKYLMRLRP